MNARVGKIQIPIFAIIAAIPQAIAAAHAVAADDHDSDSDGGAKVTPAEVAEAIGAFARALGVAALPAILRANVGT
jgi:hypothetical protein